MDRLLFFVPLKSFKIAVAYINIFRIVYIIKRLMEVGSGWIIVTSAAKVSASLPEGFFAGEKLRHGKSRLPCLLPSRAEKSGRHFTQERSMIPPMLRTTTISSKRSFTMESISFHGSER